MTDPRARPAPAADADPQVRGDLAAAAWRTGRPPEAYAAALASRPALLQRVTELAAELLPGRLPASVSDVVVEHAAWRTGAAGASASEAATPPGGDVATRAAGDDLRRLVDLLCEYREVDGGTLARLAASSPGAEPAEIAALVGLVQLLSGIARTSRTRADAASGAAPTPPDPPAVRRSAEDVVRSYFARCNDAPAEVIAGHFAPDAVVYDTNHPPVVGAEAIGRFWVDVRERWQGARWDIDALVASPGAVAVEWTMRGRRRGVPFSASGSDHLRVSGGLIAEVHQYWVLDRTRSGTGLVGYPGRPAG